MDAELSVPNATFTPAATNFAIGQNPDANFKFDEGQWMTFTWRSAHNLISSSVKGEKSSSKKLSMTAHSPGRKSGIVSKTKGILIFYEIIRIK